MGCCVKSYVGGTVCFLFSSRRRHTRLVSDWSSDVCSSDLAPEAGSSSTRRRCRRRTGSGRSRPPPRGRPRSEERRVGKEGRSRWSPYNEKKKSVVKKKSRELDGRRIIKKREKEK